MKSSKIRGDQLFSLTLDRGQHFLKVFESILVKKVQNQKTLKNVGKLFEGPLKFEKNFLSVKISNLKNDFEGPLKFEKICGHLLITFWYGPTSF